MKRLLGLLLCLSLLAGCLPALALSAASETLAGEVTLAVAVGSKPADASLLRDGKDATGLKGKAAKTLQLVLDVGDGEAMKSLYVRMDTLPAKALLRQKQGGRFVELVSLSRPGAEFVVALPAAASGRFLLDFTFDGAQAPTVTELRGYGPGSLPESLHPWEQAGKADVLLVVPAAADADPEQIAAWAGAGRQAALAVVGGVSEPLAFTDSLWAAGLRLQPLYLNQKDWHDSVVQRALVSAIRQMEPVAVAVGGSGEEAERLTRAAEGAAAAAADYASDVDDAAVRGLWQVSLVKPAGDPALAADALPAWSTEPLRTACYAIFADAQHSDPAEIPYPAERLEDGWLPEGEFVYEAPEKGLWAYLSPTLQVEIVKYEQPAIPRVWFVTDLKFRPESEQLKQVLYPNARFEGQLTWPETLAQSARLVLGINGDYFPYRVNHKANVGNIIRNRKVLYTYSHKNSPYPILDTAALRDDGSMSVYAAGEITAQALLDQGDVHDALSFGPYLARDGRLRIWNGSSWNASEPRCALGMVSPGHYKIVNVEGRFKKGVGPAGININQLACLLYAHGANEAQNLDGGNTAVLIFMGKKLNRTASKSGKSVTSPRNMAELIGIGVSEKVHTDQIDRKE